MTMKVKSFAELIVELAKSKGLTANELREATGIVRKITKKPDDYDEQGKEADI